MKLNNSLIRLLKYGIIPMNYYKVYHFDVKDTNVLADKDFTTRLTDWGLSGMIESKESIPSIIANRPLQSNLPFSNIIFNPTTLTNIEEHYNEHKKNYTYKVIESFVKNKSGLEVIPIHKIKTNHSKVFNLFFSKKDLVLENIPSAAITKSTRSFVLSSNLIRTLSLSSDTSLIFFPKRKCCV